MTEPVELMERISNELMVMIEHHKAVKNRFPDDLKNYYRLHLKHMEAVLNYVSSLEHHMRKTTPQNGSDSDKNSH